MSHTPHPVRMKFLDLVSEVRRGELDNQTRDRIKAIPGWKSHKEMTAIKTWAERVEMSGLTDDQLMMYEMRNRALRRLAGNVLTGEQEPLIYDVSALLDKLPDHDISQYSLGQLTLPADNMYIDFGSEVLFKIDAESGLFFEGAYVSQTDIPGNDASYFSVRLVCGDVDLEEAWERPLGQTLERTSNMILAEFDGTKTVAHAFSTDFTFQHFNADAAVRSKPGVIVSTLDAVARSMIYLGTNGLDLEVGCHDGASKDDLEAFLGGDETAAGSLTSAGFPPVNFVGRNLGKIDQLEEPDFDRDHTTFKI
ncbi:hypothetical protein ELI07_08710 [Rhizobium leguminosarum]|uniref:hypothetical protein n=1 Tax=Rhizobium leguminosarum TaxID=384 RepID=UPI001030CDB8|nr:hypothetical protein [Rhizobium leguminosarum]TAX09572.1 hypothetical protein ELI07_08710 [Rhizobium leguminosarum]